MNIERRGSNLSAQLGGLCVKPHLSAPTPRATTHSHTHTHTHTPPQSKLADGLHRLPWSWRVDHQGSLSLVSGAEPGRLGTNRNDEGREASAVDRLLALLTGWPAPPSPAFRRDVSHDSAAGGVLIECCCQAVWCRVWSTRTLREEETRWPLLASVPPVALHHHHRREYQ